ncbi:MAG: ABC transporter permease subunit [Spartobacteria bacterium]|nr:ABC transporter permease subunit [Spartobacteria bacterium]
MTSRITSFIQRLANPVTLKRLRRFRRRKRAWIALWVLLGLYAFSLCAELICNDNPLYVKYNGRRYFPVFAFYPEDTFLHHGKHTRPDYKAIHASPTFQEHPGNYMIFTPVPFGPLSSVDPASLRDEDIIDVTFVPQPNVGNINILSDYTVSRQTDSGYFFGCGNDEVTGRAVEEYWAFPPELKEAIALRLANREAPPYTAILRGRRDADQQTEMSLTRFSARSRPPQSVRITLRDAHEQTGKKIKLSFVQGAEKPVHGQAFWETLSTAQQTTVRERLAQAESLPAQTLPMTIRDKNYQVRIEPDTVQFPHPPVKRHFMGLDNAGRDVFARMLYGLRISLSFGLLLVAFSMTLGIVAGAIQGYFGGRVDILSQRLIEIWSALPFLYIMILMGSIYGRRFGLLLFCYGIFNWIGISYYMRAEFLRLRRQPFVDAAKCMGLPSWKIMGKHILPNALTPVITFFPFSLVGAIGSLAALDYLGFGLPPPTPSWGELLHQAQMFRWAWWLILYPALGLFAVMLSGVFIGEGVRDAFDPRPFSRME